MPIRFVANLCSWVNPRTVIKRIVGWCFGMRSQAEDGVEGRHWVETPVETERELVEIRL